MLGFLNLQTPEIIAIVVVALLLFGSRLPGIARSVGKSIVEFKKGVKDVQNDIDTEASTDKSRKSIEDKSATVESKAPEKSKEAVS